MWNYTNYLVNIVITIISIIIFEFGNMMHLFSITWKKKHFVSDNFEITLKKNTQKVQIENDAEICIELFCNFYETFNECCFETSHSQTEFSADQAEGQANG